MTVLRRENVASEEIFLDAEENQMNSHKHTFGRGTGRALGCAGLAIAAAALGQAAKAQAGETLTTLYQLSNAQGSLPAAALLLGASGALYGTAVNGGAQSAGSVFRLAPPVAGQTAWTEQTLWSFGGAPDGAKPYGGLVADASGALYGTTSGGGAHGTGAVFKLTPPTAGQTAWTETLLYSFTGGADGANPGANLILDSAGALYGATPAGGASGNGTVFKLTPPAAGQTAWTETVLYSFHGGANDGANPLCGLIWGPNGALYGTTQNGGAAAWGTVFELSPPAKGKTAWTETLVYDFTNPANGANPVAGVTLGAGGVLYGVTYSWGSGFWGTAFSLTPPSAGKTKWTFGLLHTFTGGADGGGLASPLALGTDGSLYGAAAYGGFINPYWGTGVLFKLSPPATAGGQWPFTTLATSFGQSGGPQGVRPQGGLTLGPGGAIYGTTTSGTVFELQ